MAKNEKQKILLKQKCKDNNCVCGCVYVQYSMALETPNPNNDFTQQASNDS